MGSEASTRRHMEKDWKKYEQLKGNRFPIFERHKKKNDEIFLSIIEYDDTNVYNTMILEV